jgi:hypothetical protein
LKIPWGNQDRVVDFDPDSALHLAADTAHSFVAISTFDHEPIVAQHLGYNPEQLPLIGHDHFPEFPFTQNLLFTHTLPPKLRRDNNSTSLNKDIRRLPAFPFQRNSHANHLDVRNAADMDDCGRAYESLLNCSFDYALTDEVGYVSRTNRLKSVVDIGGNAPVEIYLYL